jgi:hypothetical protein
VLVRSGWVSSQEGHQWRKLGLISVNKMGQSERGLGSLLQLSFSYPNADGWLACNHLEIVTDWDIVCRLVAVSGRGTLVPPLRLRQGTKMLFDCGPVRSGGKPALAWSAAC